MTEHPTPAADGFVADWLLAWEAADEAGGDPPDPGGVDVPPEIQARLAGGVECLKALRGTRLVRPRPAAPPADLAGRFTVLRELGRGGFGVVYHALDRVLRREVAVKVPYAEQLAHPAGWRRFTLEAELAARLDHPNVVAVFDAGADADTPYLTTEYCPGWPLSEWLRMTDGPVPWREAAGLIRTVAAAVHHAHTRGVLHRDLKPANILLAAPDPDDRRVRPLGWYTPKVADFGLAKPVSGIDERLTMSGVLPGTPAYMAPESFDGRRATPTTAADVYALGVVLYELLAGRPPFAGNTPLATLDLARTTDPPPLRPNRPDVPADVETVCLKCLRKNPAERYASVGELADDLDRAISGEPIRARPMTAVERLTRGVRRHPVATLTVLFGLVTLAALGTAVVQSSRIAEQSARMEATEAERLADQLLDDQTAVRIDAASVQSPGIRRRAIELVEKWWGEYRPDAGNWRERPAFARLPPPRQQAVVAGLGEQALLAAHAERLNAAGRPAAVGEAALERAAEWNRRAEEVFAPNIPAAVGEQRAALSERLGHRLPELPPPAADGTIDLYLRGLGRIADGDHRGAERAFERLVGIAPQHAAGQFALGFVYHSLGRDSAALERYQVAGALAPRDPRSAYNRGTLQLYHHRPEEALADLTTALDRDPKMPEAYYMRAATRLHLGHNQQRAGQQTTYTAALADVNTAMELAGRRYRFLNLRSMLRDKLGDTDGAAADRAVMDAMTLHDELDYVVRGNRRITEKRPDDTLADYRTATELNPQYVAAWHNLAAQQNAMGLTRAAADSMTREIALTPDRPQPKFERAVLLARLGDRSAALAQIAGLKPYDGHTWFQQAAVFALSSNTHPDDARTALNALKMAKRFGYDLTKFADDTDFAPLRSRAEVQAIITGKSGVDN